jgi:Ca2+:H+ antiporter
LPCIECREGQELIGAIRPLATIGEAIDMRLSRLSLIFAILAALAWAAALDPVAVFLLAVLGIIPLANLLAEATEALAFHTGPRAGALLNATFGTAVELILLFALLRSGQVDVVKAALVGSILASLILVVGLSQLLGGLQNGIQRFDREGSGMAAAMMTLAVIGLALPTVLGIVHQVYLGRSFSTEFQDPALDALSLGIAVILLLLYGLLIIFQFRQPSATEVEFEAATPAEPRSLSVRQAIGLLAAATLGVAVVSEILSGTLKPFGERLGISTLFMGVVLIPLAGNVSEILVGVRTARADKLDLSLSIASSSAMQVALFVAPLLAIISPFFGHELTLYFSIFEVFALGLAIFSAVAIASDGVSNWMEGAQFLALYLILALWFYFLVPSSS